MRTRSLSIEGGLPALFTAAEEKPYLFFLESSLPAGGLGRYSFIGFAPFAVFTVKPGAEAEIRWADGRTEKLAGEPLEALRALHRRFSVPAEPDVDGLPFAGGAVGFFSYEFGQRFERIQRTKADDLSLPEAQWAFYDGVVACDEVTGQIYAATSLAESVDAERVLDRIECAVGVLLRKRTSERVGRVVPNAPEQHRERSSVEGVDRVQPAGWRQPALPAEGFSTEDKQADAGEKKDAGVNGTVEITANFTRAGYERAVGRVKDYIRSGDVYQINLSQRFEARLRCAPAELYRRVFCGWRARVYPRGRSRAPGRAAVMRLTMRDLRPNLRAARRIARNCS